MPATGRGNASDSPSHTAIPPLFLMMALTALQMSSSLVPTAMMLCESCAIPDTNSQSLNQEFLQRKEFNSSLVLGFGAIFAIKIVCPCYGLH